MKKSLKIRLLAVVVACAVSFLALSACSEIFTPPHTHNYVEGVCKCGEKDPNYKPPHEHNFIDGVCECGEKDPNYKPPHEHNYVNGVCECGEKDANYKPPHEHNFINGVCECGEKDANYKPPHEHNFIDGVCECGEKDPDYIPDNPVIENVYRDGIADGQAEDINSAELSIHFLELGNKYTGDSTLIKVGNTEVLIDAGSRNDSAVTIKNYVDKYCTDGVLEYVIATHAHQDHISGFVGNSQGASKTGILYQYKVGTIIQFARTNSTTKIYSDYTDSVTVAESKGTAVYTALECWNNENGASRSYKLSESVTLNILYNYYYEYRTSNENNYSVCILLTQKVDNKENNYLFTGDLEEGGEKYLVERNELPKVELFKGGHHGSYTANSEKLLSVIQPKAVAFCTCCGSTEYNAAPENIFPAQATVDRVAKYTDAVYCTTLCTDYKSGNFTSMNGNIVFYYSFKEEKSEGKIEIVGQLRLYCTNVNTKLKDTQWFKENRTVPQQWK